MALAPVEEGFKMKGTAKTAYFSLPQTFKASVGALYIVLRGFCVCNSIESITTS